MLVGMRGIQFYLNFFFLYKYSMVELLQAMAAFFNVFMSSVFLDKNQQICEDSSLASADGDGGRLYQHMEAYQCPTKKSKRSR